MTDKHTPGPWNNYQGDDIYCVYDAKGRKICQVEAVDIVGWNARFRDESEANERLIAAAPEMLEALKLLMTAHGEQLDLAFQTAQEAISKATGAPWPEA